MIQCARIGTLIYAGFAVCLLGMVVPTLAKDATYCVTCKDPDQVYRCQVTGVGSRANDAVKLYCIVRTAKEGNHASCKAERGAKNCAGIAKVYNYDGPAIPPEVADDPRVQGLVDKIAREQEAFDKPTEGKAPKTMFELGGRAARASRQGWRNARDRIGGGSSQSDKKAPLPAPAPPAAESLPAAETPPAVENPPIVETPPTAESLPASSEEADHPNRMQRAGTAVGGFARKSYRCMASLFRSCREETTDGQALR